MKTLSIKQFFSINVFFIFLLTVSTSLAQDLISFEPFDRVAFNPSRQQLFEIPFTLYGDAMVEVRIYTSDDNFVRKLSSPTALEAGKHSLSWDGKDNEGDIVPDEAYSVVLSAVGKAGSMTIDPRKDSGGEVEKVASTVTENEGKIAYVLSKPSRVRIRSGVVDGPMLRSLINWQPRPSGKNVHRWSGFDKDKVVDILSLENSGLSVTAFNLPNYTILTTGNTSLSYPEYYREKSWVFTPVPFEEQLLERNNKGVSPHYYLWRVADRDPQLSIVLPEDIRKSPAGLPILQNGVGIPIKVTMNSDDEELIAETKYEVSFFVDFEFKSEEELGFMPITWLWRPNNVATGEHTLTVNVSGFKGQVGVKSVNFLIE